MRLQAGNGGRGGGVATRLASATACLKAIPIMPLKRIRAIFGGCQKSSSRRSCRVWYESHSSTSSRLTGRVLESRIKLTFEPRSLSFLQSGTQSESLVNNTSLSRVLNAARPRASQQIDISTPFSLFWNRSRTFDGHRSLANHHILKGDVLAKGLLAEAAR